MQQATIATQPLQSLQSLQSLQLLQSLQSLRRWGEQVCCRAVELAPQIREENMQVLAETPDRE